MDTGAMNHCKRLKTERPGWVEGSISAADARFLCESVLRSNPNCVVEIGTGAGYSTAILCQALNLDRLTRTTSCPDFQIFSYDAAAYFPPDKTKKIGAAAAEVLTPELLSRITFRNPLRAIDLKKHHDANEIDFLFVDASHKHPWPTLDLIATLDLLNPGAMVVLHDTNLPLVHPECPDWGAKYLFDDLELEKETPEDRRISNIGRFRIPRDKELFKRQLQKILFTHDWQSNVDESYLTAAGVTSTGMREFGTTTLAARDVREDS